MLTRRVSGISSSQSSLSAPLTDTSSADDVCSAAFHSVSPPPRPGLCRDTGRPLLPLLRRSSSVLFTDHVFDNYRMLEPVYTGSHDATRFYLNWNRPFRFDSIRYGHHVGHRLAIGCSSFTAPDCEIKCIDQSCWVYCGRCSVLLWPLITNNLLFSSIDRTCESVCEYAAW